MSRTRPTDSFPLRFFQKKFPLLIISSLRKDFLGSIFSFSRRTCDDISGELRTRRATPFLLPLLFFAIFARNRRGKELYRRRHLTLPQK